MDLKEIDEIGKKLTEALNNLQRLRDKTISNMPMLYAVVIKDVKLASCDDYGYPDDDYRLKKGDIFEFGRDPTRKKLSIDLRDGYVYLDIHIRHLTLCPIEDLPENFQLAELSPIDSDS